MKKIFRGTSGSLCRAAVLLVWALAGCSDTLSLGHDNETPTNDGSPTANDADPRHDAPSSHDEHTPIDAPGHETGPADGGYDPCLNKACGASCTICDPHDPSCVEPPGTKTCSPHQECLASEPICP
jgi:hypothetical protein